MEEYSAKDIRVLEGLEAVRKRPSMYIGDLGKRGFHHLLWEILDNAVDEALAGYAENIAVRVHKDGYISVTDDGRGIPTGVHPKYGKSALEIVTTMLHAGGKFEKKAYKVSGGLHGVGISVVNALSEWMEVIVKREGKVFRQRYERGKPVTPVEVIGETSETGTIVKFKPDLEIFSYKEGWDEDWIISKLRELSFLNKGITFIYENEINGRREVFYNDKGLEKFLEYLTEGKKKISSFIIGSHEESGIVVELAFQYTDSFYASIHSFVNNIHTEEGGTHVVGFKSGLSRAIGDFIRGKNLLKKEEKITGEDILEGLIAVIHVLHPDPQFEGQTKTKLGNSEVKRIVERFTFKLVKEFLDSHPEDAKRISQKVLASMRARLAAKKAKEAVFRKSLFDSSSLPGKLADCVTNKVDEAELFIVEGESAGGSAKQARDKRFQAILPLKGKILNVEKSPFYKMLKNEEIKSIITSLGVGIGENQDLSKLRYGKIIIMTDADVDGSHIRTLLLTLFFRYFKPLIERGHLYIAQPPLYKVKVGRELKYAFNDEELKKILKEHPNAEVQRFKGLGEMNPEELWETTMNPEKRTLKRVSIEDAERADYLFRILMGEEVSPRKEYIVKHALDVKELDV